MVSAQAAGIDVIDPFARHRRHRKFLAALSVLSQLSRWVSSRVSAPSVPVISIQVEQ